MAASSDSAVVLGYRLRGAKRSKVDPRRATATDLRYSLFPGDLLFRVGDVDFSATWGWIPALDPPLALAWAFGDLVERGVGALSFTENGERVVFALSGDSVTVSASFVEGSATCSREALHAAVCEFLERVVTELERRAPGLRDNPEFTRLVGEARTRLGA